MAELLALAGLDPADLAAELAPMRLDYGAIEGSDRLRRAIAALYETVKPDDVLVAHGAIGANHLVYEALVEPGDVVVRSSPRTSSTCRVPESLGAEVRQVRLREAEGYDWTSTSSRRPREGRSSSRSRTRTTRRARCSTATPSRGSP
ncbi:MAG: aminotransferase class I/II-fold pyridoxal phosphate-dependent enzyme [Chloroflexota bacterium]